MICNNLRQLNANWSRVRLVLVALICLASPAVLFADEIPSRVAVQAFVKADDGRLNLLMRVPMDALVEAQFPLRGEIGYVIFSEATGAMESAANSEILPGVQLFEGDRFLQSPSLDAVRIAFPSDRSFVDYDSAMANIYSPPIPDAQDLYYRQGFLDIHATYSIDSSESRFSVDARLGGLGLETTTILRYILSDGSERTFSFVGNPGLVYMDPRWYQAVLNFVILGFDHILEGADHLLLSADSFAPHFSVNSCHYFVYHRSLFDAYRFCLGLGSFKHLVSLVDRNTNSVVYCLHGLREHNRCQAAAPLDNDFCFWSGPWFWFFLPIN